MPQVLERALRPARRGPDKTTAEGAFDQAYEWPNARIGHAVVDLPVPVGFWRSVGHSHQAFFKESFIDEAAAAAGQDPVAFRAALAGSSTRATWRCCSARREMAGWGKPLAPPPTAQGARAAWRCTSPSASIVAQVAEVSVTRTGASACTAWCASSIAVPGVNPNIIAQQMESGIVFGLSAALHGEITHRQGPGAAEQLPRLPVLRIDECPVIETDIMPSAEHPEGVGEPGLPHSKACPFSYNLPGV